MLTYLLYTSLLEKAKNIVQKLSKGQKTDKIPKPLEPLFRPSVQPYLISYIKYDPGEEIKKINKPILIINGDKNIQVNIENAEILQKSNPKSKIVVIKNMNHILKNVSKNSSRSDNIKTYSNPNLLINKQLIDEISNFILSYN